MSFMSALTQGLPQPSQGGISSGNMYPGTQQLNSQHYLSRVPSLPENIYGTSQMYAPSGGAVAGAASRQDTSAYYPVKKPSDSMKLPTVVGQHYYVDHMMNPHPYSSLYPFDINAIRRKNATRETTGPLKAWLKQHRQNPYPTKGEKVMLAIATRMTMTQVSTWFANARRRMKKDKFDDDDEEKDDMPCPDADKKRERSGSISSRVSHTSSEGDTSKDFSDASDAEELSLKSRPARKCVQRLFSPDARVDHVIDPSSSPESLSERSPTTEQAFYQQRLPTISDIMHNVGGNNDTRSNDSIIPTPKTTDITSERPKIWSISEIIGSATQTVNADMSSNYNDYIPYYSNVSQYYQYQGLDAYGYHASDLGLQHQDTGIKLETDTNSNVQYL